MRDRRMHDIDSYGRERPWQEKKLANLTYAEYLRVLAFKKAHNVKQCGDVLAFRKKADGGLRLYQTWFCHGRLCPLCNWRRRLKRSVELRKILSLALKREPEGRFLFLTLTEKNASSLELKARVREQAKGFTRLMRCKELRPVLLGYVRSTEVTVNDEQSSYHHHIHAILFVKPSYFTARNYLSQEKWVSLWQKARGLNYRPSVRVQVIKPNKEKGKDSLLASAYETAKYQVKDSDVITGKVVRDVQVVKVLEESLYRTRTVSFGGVLREIRHELGLDSKEKENDLINADENDGQTVVDEVVAKWDNARKDYFWQ